MSSSHWYQNAIFYEVYVRAFKDSNGDGHGDINGLAEKLDYLKELGVDCLWLLPIYPSPLKDDGYDISDYRNIHPDYGSLEDFKCLLEEAHRRGLRVITDLVVNHTSDAHPWFQASRSDRRSPFRDYYVWSDDDRKYSQARIIFLEGTPIVSKPNLMKTGKTVPEMITNDQEFELAAIRAYNEAIALAHEVGDQASGTMFADVPSLLGGSLDQAASARRHCKRLRRRRCPENPVTRAQMAVFLVRTFNLP